MTSICEDHDKMHKPVHGCPACAEGVRRIAVAARAFVTSAKVRSGGGLDRDLLAPDWTHYAELESAVRRLYG